MAAVRRGCLRLSERLWEMGWERCGAWEMGCRVGAWGAAALWGLAVSRSACRVRGGGGERAKAGACRPAGRVLWVGRSGAGGAGGPARCGLPSLQLPRHLCVGSAPPGEAAFWVPWAAGSGTLGGPAG